MATLINNAGVQHYANKMVLAENRKVGSKNLPTALTDIDNLIDEMKTHFDAEYGSALDMKLENNENAFSLGTGTNVDKRSEVENSFTDVELSGNSVVNLADEWKDVTNETISFYYGAERSICKTSKLKNNTYYTLIANYKINLNNTTAYNRMELGLSNSKNSVTTHPSAGETNYAFNVKDGLNVIKFHLSDYKHDEYAYFNIRPIRRTTEPVEGESVTFSCSDLILLEGDYTNKPIPQYFEGLKSIGEKEDGNHKISISSTKNGLNLIKNSKNARLSPNNTGLGESVLKNDEKDLYYRATPNSDKNVSLYWVIEPNKSQLLKTNKIVIYSIMVRPEQDCSITFYGNKHSSKMTHSVKGGVWTRVYTKPFEYLVSTGESFILVVDGDMKSKYLDYKELKIEYGEKATDWCPSFEEIKQYPKYLDEKEISLNEPLRGLPNGVKDTIEKINGEWKIVRRCGEVVLDGNRTWTIWSSNTDGQNLTYNAYVYSADLDITKKTTSNSNLNVINDKVTNHYRSFIDRTGESLIVASSIIHLSILRTKLETQDTTGLKKWLSQNPIKVVYELATPIIEDVSPATLQCWKNGTISIDEVLPVESTHTVALNKPAQIKRNIEELTALRKRVQALEDFYDQVALEQSHQLSLISNSIELDYDI